MAVKQQKKQAYKPGPTAGGQRVRGINSDISDLIITTDRLKRADIASLFVGCRLERTIESASAIVIDCHDPKRHIEGKIMKGERIDASLDDLWFRLVAARRNGDFITLTFEDRASAWLRLYKGPKKALRDKVTRAQFIRSLVREVKEGEIPLYIPELHQTQPIAGKFRGGVKWQKEKHDRRAPGLSNSNVTSKGAAASPTQIENIERVLATGLSRSTRRKILICAIMTTTQESNNTNLTGGDADSVGMFQQRGSMGWPASRDIERDAAAFYRAAEKIDNNNPTLTKGELCQAVQRSAHPTAYKQWEAEATKTVDAYLEFGTGEVTGEITSYKKYAFQVEKDETYWDATGRLAQEVNWRRFTSAGIFYFMSETALAQQRVRAKLSVDSEGVDEINYDWDMGKKNTEVTVVGRAKDWAAPPGTAIVIDEEPEEIAGKYLVSSISSSLYDDAVTITLKRPTKPKKEPAPEKVTKQVSFGDAGGISGTGRAVDKLKKVKVNPKLWGGTESVFKQFIVPFMSDEGLSAGSSKEQRPKNPESDHDVDNLTAYAIDFPTTAGYRAAQRLARAMGYPSWVGDSYQTFNVKIDGYTFRVQILWGAKIDHADHVHVGLRRA